MLHGRPVGRDALRGLLGNVGLMATLAGIAVALLWPGVATLSQLTRGAGGMGTAGSTVIGALQMLGDLTIPLSLLVTGAQLTRRPASTAAEARALAGVIVCRLLVAPLVLLALAGGLALAGWRMPEAAFMTLAVIVAMPVAISCTMFVDRFGGDRELSAAGIFYTTLLSLVTVPLMVLACRAVPW
jgi:predicted permease